MKYQYFYQTKENENRSGWIKARSRENAYALLRKQGIRPYRLAGDDPVNWRPWAVAAVIVALAAALAGVSDEPPASWEETAARLVELIQSLKSQFG